MGGKDRTKERETDKQRDSQTDRNTYTPTVGCLQIVDLNKKEIRRRKITYKYNNSVKWYWILMKAKEGMIWENQNGEEEEEEIDG